MIVVHQQRHYLARQERDKSSVTTATVVAALAVVRSGGSDARSDGPAAYENTVAGGNYSSHRFATFRINHERVVVDALFHLELAYRLVRVGRFVNVSWHSGDVSIVNRAIYGPLTLLPNGIYILSSEQPAILRMRK